MFGFQYEYLWDKNTLFLMSFYLFFGKIVISKTYEVIVFLKLEI